MLHEIIADLRITGLSSYPTLNMTMFKKTEAVDSTKHKNLKLKPISNFAFAKDQNFAPISYTEMIAAAREFPIVFPSVTAENAHPLPVVLLGLSGANQFVNEQGQWLGRYIPAHFRRYPFILGTADQKDSFVILYDSDCKNLGNEEGDALFDAQGKQTEYFNKVVNFLTLFQQETTLTIELVKTLRDAGLLIEQQIQRQDGGESKAVIAGFEIIDPEKLDKIDDDLFIQWRHRGLLPLIYAHLASMENIHRLG